MGCTFGGQSCFGNSHGYASTVWAIETRRSESLPAATAIEDSAVRTCGRNLG